MEAPKPFHGDDLALENGVCGSRQDLAAAFGRSALAGQRLSSPVPQFNLWPAHGAGVGLGVEAAVKWVVILRLALRAHGEALHRGVCAVVGEGFDDAEARAAIRAVRERVTVTAIARIENLAQAVRAGRDVREHQRSPDAAGFARADFEARIADRIEPGGFEALDGAARRAVCFEAQQKRLQCNRGAFDFNEDALSGVVDPAVEPSPRG